MISFLNTNAGAVTAVATVMLLLVTGWYAYTTWSLLHEAKQSRLLAMEPRVVAYLRVHEVISNMVQLCVANLSGAAAVGVSGRVERVTEWPEKFDLEDSRMLRDIGFLRPQEVLKFDLGFGPDLFSDEKGATFTAVITFSSLDGRAFSFTGDLAIDSVVGPSWKIHGIDDVARRLKDIADALSNMGNMRRFKVETYDAGDRLQEAKAQEERREQLRKQREENDSAS